MSMLWLLVPMLVCLPVFLYDYISRFRGEVTIGSILTILGISAIPVLNVLVLMAVLKSMYYYGK